MTGLMTPTNHPLRPMTGGRLNLPFINRSVSYIA
jgi:hypothetical protein